MNKFKKISILAVLAMLFVFALFSNSSCNIYKFNEETIPDSIKTVKINFIENKAINTCAPIVVDAQLARRLRR